MKRLQVSLDCGVGEVRWGGARAAAREQAHPESPAEVVFSGRSIDATRAFASPPPASPPAGMACGEREWVATAAAATPLPPPTMATSQVSMHFISSASSAAQLLVQVASGFDAMGLGKRVWRRTTRSGHHACSASGPPSLHVP